MNKKICSLKCAQSINNSFFLWQINKCILHCIYLYNSIIKAKHRTSVNSVAYLSEFSLVYLSKCPFTHQFDQGQGICWTNQNAGVKVTEQNLRSYVQCPSDPILAHHKAWGHAPMKGTDFIVVIQTVQNALLHKKTIHVVPTCFFPEHIKLKKNKNKESSLKAI